MAGSSQLFVCKEFGLEWVFLLGGLQRSGTHGEATILEFVVHQTQDAHVVPRHVAWLRPQSFVQIRKRFLAPSLAMQHSLEYETCDFVLNPHSQGLKFRMQPRAKA